MSQVNMLAIDLAKSVDTSAVSAKSSSNDEASSARFSDVMAKQQNHESGNSSQRSGKAEQLESHHEKAGSSKPEMKNTETDADKELLDENDATVAHEAGKTQDTDNAVNANSKQEHSDAETESNQSTVESSEKVQLASNDDVAQKLLSFILASDEVSTEHVDVKVKGENKESILAEKVVAINSQAAKQSSKAQENIAQQTAELATKDVKDSDKIATTQSEVGNDEVTKQAVDINDPLKKIKSPAAEGNINEKLITDLTATAKSVKAAILVDKPLDSDAIEITVDEKLKAKETHVAVSSSTVTNNLVGIVDEENLTNETDIDSPTDKNSILASLSKENTQSIKLNAESAEIAKKQTQTMSAIDPKVVEMSGEEIKNTAKNEQSTERVIHQATVNSRLSSDNSQLNYSQGQQQGQQNQEQNLGKGEADLLKEHQKVSANTEQEIEFSEKLVINATEKSALQTTVSEAASHQVLNQQSLNYAEEQAIQSNLVKAAADSISVQSAKTAINIQAETISINRKDFVDAVKEKVMVMINQKIKQFEIRLDPPELGSMHVKLNLQNEQAAVNFVVQNQQAKEALEQNIDKLKDMLAQSGVDVGDANIEQRNQQADEGGDAAQQNSQHGLDSQESENEQIVLSGANLYKASASGVDYYA